MSNQIYALSHLHSQDLYDADNRPDEVCKELVKRGAQGLILTQHGVANIDPMRNACANSGLKFCPGMEIYVQENDDKKSHLILVALDDTGWKAISMCSTDAQNKEGYSVATMALLQKYFAPGTIGHGHVAATSACVNGVLAQPYQNNLRIDKQIRAKQKRLQNAIDPTDQSLQQKERSFLNADMEYNRIRESVQETKKLAESRFAAKERQIERAKKAGQDTSTLERELSMQKQQALQAQEKLPRMKKLLQEATKKRSLANKAFKELQEKARLYETVIDEIELLKESKSDMQQMKRQMTNLAAVYAQVFGQKNFYVELQNHGFPGEDVVYPMLANIAEQMQLPMCAANDVHMVDCSEREILKRSILRSMRYGKDFEEPTEADKQLYIKSDAELAEALSQILPPAQVEKAMLGARELFDRSNVEFKTQTHYPKFPLPNGVSSDAKLEEEVRRGLLWRFPNGLPKGKGYEERLSYELKIIESMGYSDYHLIVKDFLEYGRVVGCVPPERLAEAPLDIQQAKAWTKANGWRGGFSIGPGRGSAVGSLVCYLLGITSLDPLKYGLLFERFLNPERVSMPDIDSDIANRVRPKVIEYVKAKYGEDSVCGILTVNRLAPKGALRSAARFYGLHEHGDSRMYLRLGDQLAREIPDDVGTSFGTDVGGMTLADHMKQNHSSDQHAVQIITWAQAIEGCMTSYGAHAAGIVISDNRPIKEFMPLRWNDNLGEWTTWCDMIAVEEAQCLKMDFLGLKTLDIITDCCREVTKRGIAVDPLAIPLDDASVYEQIFCQGKTNSVFQFESSGMKGMLKRFRPSCFEDLIILVSMYRPGPMQYIDSVIEVKNGKSPTYLTPELEPILGKTYAGIVYQEQIMQIFQSLAGYTLGGADQVRRYMSKKKADKLAKERSAFIYGDAERNISGCIARGITEQAASQLFDEMTDFARYAFNKSHAAAYAYLAYITAYLKLHFPAEYFASAMRWVSDLDAIPGLVSEAETFGVKTAAPSINHAEELFTVDGGNIVYGLSAIKGVGASAKDVMAARRDGAFTCVQDFFGRVALNKTARENLIMSGTLDELCPDRIALLRDGEEMAALGKQYRDQNALAETLTAYLPLANLCDTDEDVVMAQRESGLAILFTHPFDKAALEKRINNAMAAAQAAYRKLQEKTITVSKTYDYAKALAAEKELLGVYMSMHPLDLYDTPENVPTPSGMFPTSKKVWGMVDAVKRMKRKKDGAPMAFVTLSDETKTMEIGIFPRSYDRCMQAINVGEAVLLDGNMMDDGKFAASCARRMEKRKAAEAKKKEEVTYIIRTHSLPIWHIDKEPLFRRDYEQADGIPVVIIDEVMGKQRKLNYMVKPQALGCTLDGMTISKM